MHYLFAFLLTLCYLFSFEGLTLSSLEVANGNTLLVEYTSPNGERPTQMTVDKKSYPFYKVNFTNHDYYALVPFHYNVSLGAKNLSFEYQDHNIKKIHKISDFKVIWGEYKKETLNVDSSKIKLSKANQKRADEEYAQAVKLYAKKSNRFLPMNILQKPLESFITSSFGNERLFNGSRKSYHSGVDFRAKVGTKVISMGFGRVVLVADRFYAGRSIIIDHGQGIFSGYYHMRKSNVLEGDIVDENDIIGLSGDSGRITGPHLHFSLKIHGVTVNPLQTMELLKTLL